MRRFTRDIVVGERRPERSSSIRLRQRIWFGDSLEGRGRVQVTRRDESPVVLYVDDEPINLRVFEANFRDRFNILTCQAPTEALSILANRGPEIGVLISDQRMPELTGVELLERAKEIAPDVIRMVITAYSDVQAVIDAVNRGRVSRYFVKPWIKEDLLAALEDAMRICQLQSRLREFEARVLRSERLAAIGQVSAGIAHELMNPVAYMTQNIDALRGELKVLSQFVAPRVQKERNREVEESLEELPRILNDIETGSKHIRQVALGIRAHARSEETATEADLADVVGFAAKLSRSELRQGCKLLVEGEPVRVVGGPVKICQVLLNLVVNAAQSFEGITRNGIVRVSWQVDGDCVRLQVTDDGCGIPEELQAKVFEPLFTTKPAGVGTGLGLAICRELVERMGGQIRLHSTVGAGTTVEVTLRKAAA